MLNQEIIIKLRKYKKLLSKHLKIDKMILFGSYAKGNPKKDSDLDVAIVVEKITGNYFLTTPLIWKLRREVDDRIEPILFEKNHDDSGFLDDILKTGIII